MKKARPPVHLPAGLRPLWRLLREADDAAASRQVLAGRLGISTSTLQRILVSGDVPKFASSGATTREIHAWARTLTRLAVHLGGDPRAWIEGAGITWDPAIEVVSRSAREALRHRRASRSERGGEPSHRGLEWPLPSGEGDLPAFRVGIAELGPFSRELPALGASFLEIYARRLLGAVMPSSSVVASSGEMVALADSLARPAPRMHLAVGLPGTLQDRLRAIEFLEIPGWKIHLAAGHVHRAGDSPSRLSWEEILVPGAIPDLRLAALRRGAAEIFLRGQCGWPEERVLAVKEADPVRFTAGLLAEAAARPGMPMVVVTDEEHFERIARALRTSGAVEDGYLVQEISEGREMAPAYPLSVGVAAGLGEWLEMLRQAHDGELFGSSVRLTARLFAELLASMAFDPPPGEGEGVARPRLGRRLEAFAQASDGFLDEMLSRFVHMLTSAPPVVVGRERSDPFPARSPAEARRIALAQASSFVPDAWRARLGRALGVEQFREAPVCQSCSVSIVHNRGASETYCRYCSDESGQLKVRDEVQGLIAEWLRSWQRGITADDAMVRASRFMEAMPAWARN